MLFHNRPLKADVGLVFNTNSQMVESTIGGVQLSGGKSLVKPKLATLPQ